MMFFLYLSFLMPSRSNVDVVSTRPPPPSLLVSAPQAVYPFILKYLLQSSDTPALRLALQEILLVPVEEPPDQWGDGITTRPGRVRYRIRWNRLERMLEASSRPMTAMLSLEAGSAPETRAEDSLLSNRETLDLIFTYVLSDSGAFLREALIEDILGALDDANLVVMRGLSLLSGGLIPPPASLPDRDRLAIVGTLLGNLRSLAAEQGLSSLLPSSSPNPSGPSPVQSKALADLSRQVLAAYAERQATKGVRGLFHRVERLLHASSDTSASRRRLRRRWLRQSGRDREVPLTASGASGVSERRIIGAGEIRSRAK